VNPLVSVSLVTYNHERFIAAAIESVLAQTFDDWELIVVNDGSTDATSACAHTFTDPRIIVIDQENEGPGAATNRAITEARGKYIALMSGDDVCLPDRLHAQLRTYETGDRRVLFGGSTYIDDNGNPVAGNHFASELFEFEPRSTAQILERFFTQGNFLNGVTTFSEREVFLESGLYDPILYQTQDWDLWVRLAKRYPIQIVPDPVLKYRVHPGNLSGRTIAGAVRSTIETYLIMRRFFDGMPPALFREAFAAHLVNAGASSDVELRCEQACLYLASRFRLNQLIGIEKLEELFQEPAALELLRREYAMTPQVLAGQMKRFDVMGQFDSAFTCLFLDDGRGLREELSIVCLPDGDGASFRVTFELPPVDVREARWDPYEGGWSRVRVKSVRVTFADGHQSSLDVTQLRTNGTVEPDGAFLFQTTDPMVYLPVEGRAKTVTIEGERERLVVEAVATIVEARAAERQAQAVRAVEDVLERTNATLAETDVQLANSIRARAETETRLEDVKRARAETESQLAEAIRARGALSVEYHAVSSHLAVAQNELDIMRRSRSWKLTAPLRWLARFAR